MKKWILIVHRWDKTHIMRRVAQAGEDTFNIVPDIEGVL